MNTIPHAFVGVQGIHNHHLTSTPIITAGATINTQHGEVIAVMHQFAFTGKGKTILSSGQLEMFQRTVNNKSHKIGGHQRIITKDGCVILLNIHNGLPHVTMQPHTDEELDCLPQVHLTSDLD